MADLVAMRRRLTYDQIQTHNERRRNGQITANRLSNLQTFFIEIERVHGLSRQVTWTYDGPVITLPDGESLVHQRDRAWLHINSRGAKTPFVTDNMHYIHSIQVPQQTVNFMRWIDPWYTNMRVYWDMKKLRGPSRRRYRMIPQDVVDEMQTTWDAEHPFSHIKSAAKQ